MIAAGDARTVTQPLTPRRRRARGGDAMPTSDAGSRTREIVDRLARTLRSAMDHGVACKYCEGWLTRGGQVCGAGIEL